MREQPNKPGGELHINQLFSSAPYLTIISPFAPAPIEEVEYLLHCSEVPLNVFSGYRQGCLQFPEPLRIIHYHFEWEQVLL